MSALNLIASLKGCLSDFDRHFKPLYNLINHTSYLLNHFILVPAGLMYFTFLPGGDHTAPFPVFIDNRRDCIMAWRCEKEYYIFLEKESGMMTIPEGGDILRQDQGGKVTQHFNSILFPKSRSLPASSRVVN